MSVISYPVPTLGTIKPKYLIIHVAEGDGDGSGLAAYCKTNPNGYRWNRSIGNTGDVYVHYGWDGEGAHAACLNNEAAGLEHAGFTHVTDWSTRTAQLKASAAQAADFCRSIGKAPDRSFIFGHDEANVSHGGCSTHTDPGSFGGANPWPWDTYFKMIQAAYDGEDDMLTKDAGAALAFLWGQNERRKGNKRPVTKTPPNPDMGDGADHTAAAQSGWDAEDGAALPVVKP